MWDVWAERNVENMKANSFDLAMFRAASKDAGRHADSLLYRGGLDSCGCGWILEKITGIPVTERLCDPWDAATVKRLSDETKWDVILREIPKNWYCFFVSTRMFLRACAAQGMGLYFVRDAR